jgi:hypothetical protein
MYPLVVARERRIIVSVVLYAVPDLGAQFLLELLVIIQLWFVERYMFPVKYCSTYVINEAVKWFGTQLKVTPKSIVVPHPVGAVKQPPCTSLEPILFSHHSEEQFIGFLSPSYLNHAQYNEHSIVNR